MANGQAVPVIIGVGDIVNRSLKVEDAIEPLHLITSAISKATEDTGVPQSRVPDLKSAIDSLDLVSSWTWPYSDLLSLIAQEAGIDPSHRHTSPHGGNQPAKLLDEACRRIAARQSKVALITGGEALASLNACMKARKFPPKGWTKADNSVDSIFSPTTRSLGTNLGAKHSVGHPIQVYPLYENGFRASRGQSLRQNNEESAQLYADFARVADSNPYAWSHGSPAETEQSIGSLSERNRMICSPYPLLMNAFNTVNLAAAVILTSTDFARQIGVPESKWIYPLGGAGTSDSTDFWNRPNYHSSPAIAHSLDAGLAASGLTVDQIDLFDFYSCFPIVPKLACQHLGLPQTGGTKPITLLGGLTSFGGAGNNYSMHAVTEMTRQLRSGRGKNGLVLANGGVLTYQHVVCLSTKARGDGRGYSESNPLPDMLEDKEAPVVDEETHGEAVIETYTVDFNRDGTPKLGHVVGKLKSSGHRFLANHGDDETLKQLASSDKEPIGREGFVQKDKQEARNVFTFSSRARL